MNVKGKVGLREDLVTAARLEGYLGRGVQLYLFFSLDIKEEPGNRLLALLPGALYRLLIKCDNL